MKILSLLQSLQSFLLKPVMLIVLLVLSIATAGLSYNQYVASQNEVKKLRENPQAAVREEAQALISRVGQLVALPQGEEPTVATITDKERLKDQPFFTKAENGDKVLIYTQAKRAYLYSAKLNKVLEIAPINIGTGQGQVAGEQTEEKKITPTPTRAPRR